VSPLKPLSLEPSEGIEPDFDPVEFEIFKNMFVSVAEEMGMGLRRTSFSPNIKERRDYSCGFFDADCQMIAMGDHMPVHLGAMPLSVKSAVEKSRLEPGDAVLVNDPYRGGTHLPDITLVSPVYLPGEDRPAFFVANRAHHSDVGGISPGSMPLAREIFQEGIIIPVVKLLRRGELQRDVLDLILANVRTPEEREGDLTAQIAANRIGERRLLEIAARYGVERLHRQVALTLDYSERVARRAIESIPDGTYHFSDRMDDDGVSERPAGVSVSVTIRGDSAIVDYSKSDPQVPGSINANYAITLSATMYVFRCLIADEIPYNSGILRPVRVVTRPATLVDARHPAAVAGGNVETSQRITDVLLGALAQAIPERIPAASSGTMNNLTVGGFDSRHGRSFAYYETVAGGMGASAEGAGLSGIHTHMTNSLNTPVEALEHYYPFRIGKYRLRRGSGGAGRHPGGDGIVREIEFLVPSEVTLLSDRRKFAPYGLAGGGPGKPGSNVLLQASGKNRTLPSKFTIQVEAGDVLIIETPGGGGFGRRD